MAKLENYFSPLSSNSLPLHVRPEVRKELFIKLTFSRLPSSHPENRRTISLRPHLPPTHTDQLPILSIQPFPYNYVKYVKSHCVQVSRSINNSPPSSFCSPLFPISPMLVTLPFSLLHPHMFHCCINTPPALMKVRIPFLSRGTSPSPVLSQLGEKRCDERGKRLMAIHLYIFHTVH